MSELTKEIENGRLLKKNGSWMYCDKCNNTVGYLCYSTYQSVKFNFQCKCGSSGSFNLKYATDLNAIKSSKQLTKNKNRLCCPNDESPLFSIADKNIEKLDYAIVCKECGCEFSNN